MSQPNEPVQNYEVVSPSLEAQVKSLLPSVAGYGGLLRSTNTIIPVVDLSQAAEGSTLPESLQQALAFGSQTAFSVENTTSTLENAPGFYRVIGSIGGSTSTGEGVIGSIILNDSASDKIVFGLNTVHATTQNQNAFVPFDFIVFLDTAHSLKATANSRTSVIGSTRQIAQVNGTLVNPSGFTFT